VWGPVEAYVSRSCDAELGVTEDNEKDDGERLLERDFRWRVHFLKLRYCQHHPS
jgi:hypothetical protein